MKQKKQVRRSFPREFKLEAVRQVVEQNKSMAEVARELGIGAGLLGRWKEQLVDDGEQAFPGKGRLKVADEELRRLERENRHLRLELEFVKNVSAGLGTSRVRNSGRAIREERP